MGLADLASAGPPRGNSVGWELGCHFASEGAQAGAAAGVLGAPIVGLLRKVRGAAAFYYTVLPHASGIGMLGGVVVGGIATLAIGSSEDPERLQTRALTAHEVETSRRHQWAMLGAGAAGMLATPGPGSVLFQQTSWAPRLAGGTAIGLVFGLASFAATTLPAVQPLVRYLPAGLQPVGNSMDLLPCRERGFEPSASFLSNDRSMHACVPLPPAALHLLLSTAGLDGARGMRPDPSLIRSQMEGWRREAVAYAVRMELP